MTLFGIDVSNHQGNFDFAAAKAEGFAFATHKITEGSGYRDPFWPRAAAEMATYFPGRWGGYVFCRTNTDPASEAETLRNHAGGVDFPLQVDYEDTTNGGSVDDLLRRFDAYRAVGFQ
ncbi:MAG: GH25 family lysozyme, partial [Rhodococcus fascians]